MNPLHSPPLHRAKIRHRQRSEQNPQLLSRIRPRPAKRLLLVPHGVPLLITPFLEGAKANSLPSARLPYFLPATMSQDAHFNSPAYLPPLAQLLVLGEDEIDDEIDWEALGLGREHAAELIRMAMDEALYYADSDSEAVWAPIYAWRALGQLQVEEAIAPLVTVLRRADREGGDDWVSGELPDILGAFGKPALEPLAAFLEDAANGDYSRAGAAAALSILGAKHPEVRLECIERLSRQLGAFAAQSGELNGLILGPMMDLQAVEALPVIREAFAAGAVDEMIVGDIEDVEIGFGLRLPRPQREPSLESLLQERPESSQKKAAKFQSAAASASDRPARVTAGDGVPFIADVKIGRNDPCPCSSGKKFKKCCGK